MTSTDKKEFVCAYFERFGEKIGRLPKMYSDALSEEAFTLCVVYIDRLASGYYGGEAGKNRENFCRALRELSGNPLFAMLHPQMLLQQAQEYFPSAFSLLSSIAESQPHHLLSEARIAIDVKSSDMKPREKQTLIENLWRASIASVCYTDVRGPEIHGAGSGGMSFDESIFEGRKGVKLTFEVMYEALCRIFEHVKKKSAETGHWFGNSNYPGPRPSDC